MTWLDENDDQAIRDLLVGRKVSKVDADRLLLDDGTVLTLVGNGGCGCGAGDYELTELNGCDNIITAVELENSPGGGGDIGRYEGTYRIFVYADNQRINLATFEGSDGSGYYGTGYTILVERPAQAETER